MTKRKRYSAECKVKLALQAIREELTAAELAKKYDIHPTMISGWERTTIENLALMDINDRQFLETPCVMGRVRWPAPCRVKRITADDIGSVGCCD